MALSSDWMADARCHDTWPALDMITIGSGYEPEPIIEEYCDHCPVVVQCGQLALATWGETMGIWGGVYIPGTNGSRTGHSTKTRRKARAELEAKLAILTNSEQAA